LWSTRDVRIALPYTPNPPWLKPTWRILKLANSLRHRGAEHQRLAPVGGIAHQYQRMMLMTVCATTKLAYTHSLLLEVRTASTHFSHPAVLSFDSNVGPDAAP
jgi:hypothetical protein